MKLLNKGGAWLIKKSERIIAVICAISLVLSVISIFFSINRTNTNNRLRTEDVQYVLYLGTNDKDKNELLISKNEAKVRLDSVLAKYFSGWTVMEANGAWSEDDTIFNEWTLVIHLSDATSDKVYAACDELLSIFNQSSILIQTNKTKTEFYSTPN